MQVLSPAQALSIVVSLAGVAVALGLLIKGTRGRSLVTGIIGTALLLLGTVSGLAYRWVLTLLIGRVSDDTVFVILAAQTVTGSVLTGAGLLLLCYALVVANRLPKSSSRIKAERVPR